MNDNENSSFRTVRGYQLANQQEGQLTPAMEDYLEMAYRLCLQNEYTRVGKLSELLNVKPPSASKMIFKLANLGFLEYDRYEIILLTEKGRELGAYLLRRHNTVEEFLKLIGCANPLEEAELIEHSLSPSTVRDLNDLLEFFSSNAEARSAYEAYRAGKGK
ncbi:iron (metal) dependent repressor, DtxR family [Sporobacter termitidis DSM 10068]|uniref:Manganese transport regulator n=1 Tax=Sporobacter termitidis DSM 10068 TaxID=1123282 RepID=A0A1M5YE19_9FIRM|nr:iron dependent repressor, metal binding and dimerization domain protein [Sporobacter termitidis]SHI10277.1 iron (metal) dependent repressor, DtxR family [Sporobacter termitidis DSM 10068]